MKNYVKIQSSVTINVTPGLQNQDVTNADAHIPDRLKVNAVWPKLIVLIKAGQHWYPAEIAQWPSVIALVNAKLATIGEYSDEPLDDVEEAKKSKAKLHKEFSKLESKEEKTEVKQVKKQRKTTEKSLDEISEGE